MNFSVSSLIAGFLFSTIGFWLFMAGKKRAQVPVAVIGVILMIYSYFTPNPWFDWGGGILLCALAHKYWNG